MCVQGCSPNLICLLYVKQPLSAHLHVGSSQSYWAGLRFLRPVRSDLSLENRTSPRGLRAGRGGPGPAPLSQES